MEKSKRMVRDIEDILSRPAKWNDLMIGRVRKTLMEVQKILAEQTQTIQIIKHLRSDVKYKRNLKIVEEYKTGLSLGYLGRKYHLTRQRIHTIIKTFDV